MVVQTLLIPQWKQILQIALGDSAALLSPAQRFLLDSYFEQLTTNLLLQKFMIRTEKTTIKDH